MKMSLDTTVFIYATGRDHPLREPCRRLLALLPQRGIQPDVSIELLQEYVHVRTRGGIGRDQAQAESNHVVAMCRVHDLTMGRMQLALRLFVGNDSLGMTDAIHAATAVSNLADVIVTPDRDFDGIEGLKRLDPHDAVELLGA